MRFNRIFFYSFSFVTIVPILLVMFAEYWISLENDRYDSTNKLNLIYKSSLLRNDVEREVNTKINLCMGLIVYVATNPDLSQEEFEKVAQELIKREESIRNIGLARDMVISHIYPYEENRKAIGLRYMEKEDQKDAVIKAIETQNTVIAGPVNLVQGGKGFINRIPIYRDINLNDIWGIASVVIDYDYERRAFELRAEELGIAASLRGSDGLGREGGMIFGDSLIFESEDVLILPIKLPVGEWVLATKPIHSKKGNLAIHRGVIYAVMTIIFILLILIFRLYRKQNHLALHDPLTGLSNRRLADEYIKQAIALATRKKSNFGILYIDLDRFKPINDTLGHKAGDEVLKETALRMVSTLRESDICARIGGDEFIVIIQEMSSPVAILPLIEKLGDTLGKPIVIQSGAEVTTGASIGLSIFPIHGDSVNALIKYADSDMYRKKEHKDHKR